MVILRILRLRPIWKDGPMRSSHEFKRKHEHYKKGASAPVPHLSAKALVASESPEAPPSSGSAKALPEHSGNTGGFHSPLEGRRCRSRVSGSSVSNEHQRSSTSSSLISCSPKVGPALGVPVRSSPRDGIISSHALASASSDRSILMLGAAGGARRSPIVSVGRKVGNRSHQTRDDLATKALDASTLSGMFSMLGACAALPGATARRADSQKNGDDDTSGNTRRAREADSPKAKHKQSKKLSAAVAAAVSVKDPSEFRSLRRGSQGSSHLGEQFETGSFSPTACLSRSIGSESSGKADSAAFRSKIGSRASIRADHTPSPERGDPSPRPEHMRARRTVSLGVTEPPVRHKVAALQGDNGADQHGEPSSNTHEEILEDSEGTLRKREDSGDSLRAARLPEERYTCEAESKAALEAENLRSSFRKNDQGSKRKVDAPEACRSRENVNPRRSPRSRSSSAEPPFSKAPSSQGNTRSHRLHKPSETHETRKSSDAEQRHGQDRISRTSQHGYTEAEAPPRAMGQQNQALTEQLSLQDRSTKDRRVESCRSRSKEELRTDDQQRPTQHLQSGIQQECAKTQDEQTASAAALLAAAAGVVDASLQQQQHMIQRQREHHEDLQRAQQRRIDMLQEQLETLRKSREEQRESGEQQQRKLIETLQTKLEELQRRQEQREQDLQEAQRKLLQQELEVQLKHKLEELRCSSERQIVDTAGTCSVRNDLRGQRSHRHESEFQTHRLSCQEPGKSCETVTNEGSLHLPAQQDNGWKRASDAHLHTSSGNFTGSIASRSDQLLPRGKSDDNTLACHCGKMEHFGGDGGMHACSSSAQALEQHALSASSRGVCVPDDRSSGSEETSSCASSSLMGSQCSLPLHGCVIEDAPTTTSSSFISHSEKPGVPPSMPSQRGSYLVTDGSFERQINALAGNRFAHQGAVLQGRESVLHRHTRLRPQPSESISASPQSMQASPGPPDSILSSCVVQRINSSAGSLWSPKASKSQATGIGDRAARYAASNAVPSRSVSVSNFNCGSMTPSAGRQEFLLQGERRYSSGGLRYPSDQEQVLRDNGAGLNRPQLSAHHPVSRAERAFALQQTPIDSARFLGGSRMGEKCQTLSGISRHQQGSLLARDSHLPAPPASARSLASTSSVVLPAQRSLLAHATKLPPYSRDHSKCSLASSDFLGVSSARSSTGRRHGDPRSSQNSDAKRSRHSKSGETQMPCSSCRPRSESGARTTRSLNTGHDSSLYGPRRTVNPLLSRQQCSAASEYRSPRQRENLAFSTAGTDIPGCGHKESATRLDGSGAAAVSYRRTSTSATAPDADLSRYSSRHRQKMRHGTSREDRPDEKRERNEDKKSEISTGGNPHSAAPLSVGWSGFNGSFMSQVQKWIS
ncbi:hypothetical protein ETH_00029570 [Eimeria tenella]|uniref:Uncharacterized protein n=1 Tax=Eimeria tenella TaxID=5802 RepID=U6KM21_EIMTE|nr:hypothetical protein ETH_00029570 [Eimeria tenella]CDJ39041.1 hypothetical protein ETH_00029570 [Eimeria tenella]|eukprot:XP_013229796.1 hypothetical protein ETH_00029570 [Eimeria tenella]